MAVEPPVVDVPPIPVENPELLLEFDPVVPEGEELLDPNPELLLPYEEDPEELKGEDEELEDPKGEDEELEEPNGDRKSVV